MLEDEEEEEGEAEYNRHWSKTEEEKDALKRRKKLRRVKLKSEENRKIKRIL